MSRIPTPATIADTPVQTHAQLEAVNKQLGVVPNLFRLLANSPAALNAYMGLSSALSKGTLGAQTGERIALAVAQINRCDYCLSAHSYLAANIAKLDDAEIIANRQGGSGDVKANAAVRFASKVTLERGHINAADLEEIKAAGYDNAQILEIVQHVALNVLTNYVNVVADTEIDFPVVHAGDLKQA